MLSPRSYEFIADKATGSVYFASSLERLGSSSFAMVCRKSSSSFFVLQDRGIKAFDMSYHQLASCAPLQSLKKIKNKKNNLLFFSVPAMVEEEQQS